MTLDDFHQLDAEQDMEFSFVRHVLTRHGVEEPSEPELLDALNVHSTYTAVIGDLHDDEPEQFCAVWEPALSGLLRAEAFLTLGITRPTKDQWRDIYLRLTSAGALTCAEAPLLSLRSESVQ